MERRETLREESNEEKSLIYTLFGTIVNKGNFLCKRETKGVISCSGSRSRVTFKKLEGLTFDPSHPVRASVNKDYTWTYTRMGLDRGYLVKGTE